MFRKYLEEDIKDLEQEIKESTDKEEIEELQELIEEKKKQDKPYDRIEVPEITAATLKKVVRQSWFDLSKYAEYGQPMENLENGYVTPEFLKKVIQVVFKENSKGAFPKSTKAMFGTRNKARFIKSKLQELIK